MTAEPLPPGWRRNDVVFSNDGRWCIRNIADGRYWLLDITDGPNSPIIHRGSLASCIEFAEGERK